MSKVCYGCSKERKVNSRGYCSRCWKQHNEKARVKARVEGISLRRAMRNSLWGLQQQGY